MILFIFLYIKTSERNETRYLFVYIFHFLILLKIRFCFILKKVIKNQASVLQFFHTYLCEQKNYEPMTNKNVS